MTNTELIRLIRQSDIDDRDALEIIKLFEIMSAQKKVEILDNWNKIAYEVKERRRKTEEEKEMLLLKTLDEIEDDLTNYYKSSATKSAKRDIEELKFQV